MSTAPTNPSKQPLERANTFQKQQRVNEAYELLLSCHSTRQICDIFNAKYHIKAEATKRYIYEAKKLLAELDVRKPQYKRAEAVKRLEHLYFKAYSDKQWSTCLKIMSQIIDLYKLNQIDETAQVQPYTIQIKGLPRKESV